MAVCGVGAVFLYGRDRGGGARAGGGLLSCESGADVHAAAWARTAVDGVVCGDAGRDQPLSLLLQSVGDSGAAGDRADFGSAESGGAAAEDEAASDGFGWNRAAVCVDVADENDGCISGSGGWVGNDCAALGETKAGVEVRAGGCGERGWWVWRVDGADRGGRGGGGLYVFLCRREWLPHAVRTYVAAGIFLVVDSRAALDRSQPDAAGGNAGSGR